MSEAKRVAVAKVSLSLLRDLLLPDRCDIEITDTRSDWYDGTMILRLEGPGLPDECEVQPGDSIRAVQIIGTRVTTELEVSE